MGNLSSSSSSPRPAFAAGEFPSAAAAGAVPTLSPAFPGAAGEAAAEGVAAAGLGLNIPQPAMHCPRLSHREGARQISGDVKASLMRRILHHRRKIVKFGTGIKKSPASKSPAGEGGTD